MTVRKERSQRNKSVSKHDSWLEVRAMAMEKPKVKPSIKCTIRRVEKKASKDASLDPSEDAPSDAEEDASCDQSARSAKTDTLPSPSPKFLAQLMDRIQSAATEATAPARPAREKRPVQVFEPPSEKSKLRSTPRSKPKVLATEYRRKNITGIRRDTILFDQKHACSVCSRKFSHSSNITVDHILCEQFKGMGGLTEEMIDSRENLHAICEKCNHVKTYNVDRILKQRLTDGLPLTQKIALGILRSQCIKHYGKDYLHTQPPKEAVGGVEVENIPMTPSAISPHGVPGLTGPFVDIVIGSQKIRVKCGSEIHFIQ
jgi:5-methylcytosine-specific restriction endonuclease McrA